MKISLYIANMAYKYGGTESYTANLLQALQAISRDYEISIITEYYKDTKKLTSEEMAQRLNDAYGVSVSSNKLSIEYIETKEYKNRIEYRRFEKTLQSITKKFDLFIYCSRGLITGRAKKNIAVIHFPMERKVTFPTYRKLPFLKPLAIKSDNAFKNNYDFFIPNSNFTSYWLKQKWNISDDKIKVLYPPVTLVKMKAEKKPNQIFVCSRIEKSKKIDDLIKAYSNSKILNHHCSLTIAGSIKNESAEYKEYLTGINPNVNFVFEPSRAQIEQLYSESEIFWHAKGYGEENPYNMEHFGITTVEAMSAGCIPIVINKGGQPEIVKEGTGFTWDTIEELTEKTEQLINLTEKNKKDISLAAMERSKYFDTEHFTEQLKKLLEKL